MHLNAGAGTKRPDHGLDEVLRHALATGERRAEHSLRRGVPLLG